MTPLCRRITEQIVADGPIPVSTYMALCLLDPEHGYYTTATPFGTAGDFTTAPEISQMFGELIGIWALSTWQSLGSPTPFVLAEAGPGRGTLMNDLLRATQSHSEFRAALTVHLIEASPQLAQQQSETLGGHDVRIEWCDNLAALPDRPTILIANELLDALPIRQCVKTGDGWRERCVGVNKEGQLIFTAGATAPNGDLLPSGAYTQPEGAIFEYAPAREAFAADLSRHLVAHGGAALLIDYGHLNTGFGDTLQAVKDHQFTDVLAAPGEADLTSHVDFEALGTIARKSGANTFQPITQGDFLLKLGLLERAGALGHSKDDQTQNDLHAAVERLAGAGQDQMGALFKVMCLSGTDVPIFPFDAG